MSDSETTMSAATRSIRCLISSLNSVSRDSLFPPLVEQGLHIAGDVLPAALVEHRDPRRKFLLQHGGSWPRQLNDVRRGLRYRRDFGCPLLRCAVLLTPRLS